MGTRVRIEKQKPDDDRLLKEVKTVYSDAEATELLKNGWVYLHAGATHIDSMGYNAKTTFILGKK